MDGRNIPFILCYLCTAANKLLSQRFRSKLNIDMHFLLCTSCFSKSVLLIVQSCCNFIQGYERKVKLFILPVDCTMLLVQVEKDTPREREEMGTALTTRDKYVL